MAEAEHIDRRRAALIAYDVCRRALTPSDAARRDTIVIGGGATNRGVETSVREAFNLDIASIVVRECCWGSDAAAHAYSLDKAMKMYARIRSLDHVAAMLRG